VYATTGRAVWHSGAKASVPLSKHRSSASIFRLSHNASIFTPTEVTGKDSDISQFYYAALFEDTKLCFKVFLHLLNLFLKMNVYCIVAPCGLVDVYRSLRGDGAGSKHL
jgi:hypothetical protein